MQSHGGRKKKLRLALRFHRTGSARWSCEECRRAELERQRNCAYLPNPQASERIVWIDGDIYSERCPRSVLTAESYRWVELFASLRQKPAVTLGWAARDAEAMALMEQWMSEEQANG